jgi:hypothetical protein
MLKEVVAARHFSGTNEENYENHRIAGFVTEIGHIDR